MDSEWDEGKRRANILKHGLDLVAAVKVFDGWFIETGPETRLWRATLSGCRRAGRPDNPDRLYLAKRA
jgi:hypothetical protein